MPERVDHVPEQRERVEGARVLEDVGVADRDGRDVAREQRVLVGAHVTHGAEDHRDLVGRGSAADQIGDVVGDEGGLGPLIARAVQAHVRAAGIGRLSRAMAHRAFVPFGREREDPVGARAAERAGGAVRIAGERDAIERLAADRLEQSEFA